MEVKDILNLKMESNDANAATIGEYLVALAETCWNMESGFCGKRPFGNSGWKHDIHLCLARNNLVSHEVDSNGYFENINQNECEKIVQACFAYIYKSFTHQDMLDFLEKEKNNLQVAIDIIAKWECEFLHPPELMMRGALIQLERVLDFNTNSLKKDKE
jgi:hypothetical protein